MLRDYQDKAADVLVSSLLQHGVAFDTSDTGTGKTYTAMGVIQRLKPPDTLVVCPKSLIPTWQEIQIAFGLEFDVMNYERLKTGRTPWVKKKGKQFIWTAQPGSLVIFDEAHRCGGGWVCANKRRGSSQNSKLCALTKAYKLRTLMLSATLADSVVKMRALGYLAGLHDYQSFGRWLISLGCTFDNRGNPHLSDIQSQVVMEQLHHFLFPAYGARVRISEIPDFPENTVETVLCTVGDAKAIDEAYAELCDVELDPSGNPMVAQLRARQKIEIAKIPSLIEMAQDAMADGMSPVIFLNFRESVKLVNEKLGGSTVWGSQSTEERGEQIARFQANETQSMVMTIGAGGVGVSLHDLQGGHPRVSLICPSFNAVELRQALGRIHRAGVKSPALQKILYAAKTVEEKIRRRVASKLSNLDILNDGDLTP